MVVSKLILTLFCILSCNLYGLSAFAVTESVQGLTAFNAMAASSPFFEEQLKSIITELEADITSPRNSDLAGRKCLNGKPVENYASDKIFEYWLSLECPYCKSSPVLEIQEKNPDMCIIIRHSPDEASSIEKSLIYEGLAAQSLTAAKEFWDEILPNSDMELLSIDVKEVLERLLQKYSLDNDFFVSATYLNATKLVNQDKFDSFDHISYTPTFVIQGVRLSGCDLNDQELQMVLNLLTKIRTGDEEAKKQLIAFIFKEQNE